VLLAFSLLPELWAGASFSHLVGYRCGLGCFFGAFIPEAFYGSLFRSAGALCAAHGIVDVISP
jgi:hypothetical protein